MGAVELDAIPPDLLTDLVEGAIQRHINFREWDIQRAIEKEERLDLRKLVQRVSEDEEESED